MSETTTNGTPPSVYQQRATLESRKKWLDAETSRVKKQIATLNERVLEAMAEDGVTSVKTPDGITVYQHHQPRVSVKAGNWEPLAAVLDLAHQCLHSPYRRDRQIDAARQWGVSIHDVRDFATAIVELRGMMRRQINLNTFSSWYRERLGDFNDVVAEEYHKLLADGIEPDVAQDQLEVLLAEPIAPLPMPIAALVEGIAKPSARVRGAKPVLAELNPTPGD